MPLVIELGWAPADPAAVHALIALPRGPVPRSVGGRLRSALDEWPAVGSEKWNEGLRRALDRIGDEGGKKKNNKLSTEEATTA